METKRCGHCKQPKPLTDFGPDRRSKSGLKSICRQCDTDIHVAWYAAHKNEPRVIHGRRKNTKRSLARFADKKRRGECYFCENPAKEGQTRCEDHLRRACESNKEGNLVRRKACIAAYGGKCECCGEAECGFLTIDHINNDGAEHRRSLVRSGKRSSAGTQFYIWLVREGFPQGFRCLCYNCNCGRYRNGGICPHKEKR